MFKKSRFALIALILLLALAPATALAQDETPEPPEDTVVVVTEAPTEELAPTEQVGITLDSVIALLIFLLGFFPILGGSIGALVSTIVDVIKSIGLLKDGWAALPLLLLNALAIVLLFTVFGLQPGDAIPADLDATLAQLAEIIGLVLTFVGSLGFGKLFHDKIMKPLSPKFSYSTPKSKTPI